MSYSRRESLLFTVPDVCQDIITEASTEALKFLDMIVFRGIVKYGYKTGVSR